VRDTPDYIFDPDSIGHLFPEYGRPLLPDNKRLEHRVVAPIPDKAVGLQQAFIQGVYREAVDRVKAAGQLVAIGYSFNSHDRASYKPLLDALATCRNPKVILVTPNAVELRTRLAEEYPRIKWCVDPFPFRSWVLRGFPGA